MANLWDDLVKWLDDASKVVGKEAGDLTLKGRLKIEIFELKRKLRDYLTDLGSAVYDMVFIKKNDGWKTNSKVKSLVKKIKNTQRLLKKKELEYKHIGKKMKTKKSKRKRKRG